MCSSQAKLNNYGLLPQVGSILSESGCKPKTDIFMDIMGLSKESVSDSRDTLYNQMIVKYDDACRTLGITADCQPFLKLKYGGWEKGRNLSLPGNCSIQRHIIIVMPLLTG